MGEEINFSYETGLELMETIDKEIGIRDVLIQFGVGIIDKNNGREGWACCPFHVENTPSFHVDYDRNFYFCFGCHMGGNIIEFTKRKLDTDWRGAIVALCNMYNIDIKWRPGTDEKNLLRRMYTSLEVNRNVKRTKEIFDRIVYNINRKLYECSKLRDLKSDELNKLFDFYAIIDREINSEDYNVSVLQSIDNSLDNKLLELREK